MKYFPIISYLLIVLIIFWSLYLWVIGFIENKKIKKLKSLYPDGFMYQDEAFFAVSNHGELPIISNNHLKLLNSIDKSLIEKASDGKVCISVPNPSVWW